MTREFKRAILFEDLRASFRLTRKNILPFLLGLVGVLAVTILLLALVFALVLIPLLIWVGDIQGVIEFFSDLRLLFDLEPTPSIVGVGLLFLIPFLSPFYVSVGALFGMGREIAESNDTTIDGVFTWYSRNFFSFAGAGMILFLVSIVPPAVLIVTIQSLLGYTTIEQVSWVIIVCGFLWIVSVLGVFCMMFPAIVDGLSVSDALKCSLRMSWDSTGRVLSTYLSFLFLILLLVAPLFLVGRELIFSIIGGWYIVIFLVLLTCILFPSLTIALNRVYLILSGEEIGGPTESDYPDISFVDEA